jgi:glycyl-tRNA synthetase beta chain
MNAESAAELSREELIALVGALRAQIAELERRLGLNSSNSGKAPSSDELKKLEVLPEFTDTLEFRELASAFKRIRNIAKELPGSEFSIAESTGEPLLLVEPAERALADEIEKRRPVIEAAVATGDGFRRAFSEAAHFKPAVDKFFDDVLVMAPDPAVRRSRLRLLRRLEALILKLADISEIVQEER